MKICPNCGANNHDYATFCPQCGTPLQPGPAPAPASSDRQTQGRSAPPVPEAPGQKAVNKAYGIGSAAPAYQAPPQAAPTANSAYLPPQPPGADFSARPVTDAKDLPAQFKPIGAWGYVGYDILFALPLIGFILIIVFAVSGAKVNRQKYARAQLCKLLLIVIITLVLTIIFIASGSLQSIVDQVQSFGQGLR